MPPTGPAPRIGADPGRNASTISRELHRGGGWSAYRALADQAAAVEQARTAHRRTRLLEAHPALLALVRAQLRLRWSPQQISHWLPTAHPDQPSLSAVYSPRVKLVGGFSACRSWSLLVAAG